MKYHFIYKIKDDAQKKEEIGINQEGPQNLKSCSPKRRLVLLMYVYSLRVKEAREIYMYLIILE